jgi:hypothetical protein
MSQAAYFDLVQQQYNQVLDSTLVISNQRGKLWYKTFYHWKSI